jgi:hypothetical protein
MGEVPVFGNEDDILGIAEVAAVTPWSESSLYRIAQEGGDSPFRKRRGRWATTRADLAAWVRAGYVPTKREPVGGPMPMPRRSRRSRGGVLDAVHQLRGVSAHELHT